MNEQKKFLEEFNAKLVNVVGGGNLNQELDLAELQKGLVGDEIRYEPEVWAGLYIRFKEYQPAVLVFSSGKYNIAGADSVKELKEADSILRSRLTDLGVEIEETAPDVRNQVYVCQYESEFDLNTLAIGLGIENTEYEPENFPSIFYDIPSEKGTFIISRTGKIVLTGVRNWREAKDSVSTLFKKFDELLSTD